MFFEAGARFHPVALNHQHFLQTFSSSNRNKPRLAELKRHNLDSNGMTWFGELSAFFCSVEKTQWKGTTIFFPPNWNRCFKGNLF